MRVQVLTLAAVLAFAVPAAADRDHKYDGRGYGYGRYGGGTYDIGYTNGYEEGLEHGRKDAQKGRGYGFTHDSKYRHGTHGYRRSYGSRTTYAGGFRRGYEAGYREAYQAFASRYGRGGHGRYRDYGSRDRMYKDDRYGGGRYGSYGDAYDWRSDGRHRHYGRSGWCDDRH